MSRLMGFQGYYLVQSLPGGSPRQVVSLITCAIVYWLEAGHSSCQGLHRGVNIRGQKSLGSHQGLSTTRAVTQTCPHLPQWGPDPAPPPAPARLWVPVSGAGHPRECTKVSFHLPKMCGPPHLQNFLSRVYTFLNCFAIIFMKFPEEAEVSMRFSLQVKPPLPTS